MAKSIVDRSYLGPLLWILGLQYLIIQIVAARAWQTSFSLANNTISDLGNTVCGDYSGRFVCSPLHNLMNLAFIVFGLTTLLGAWLIYNRQAKSRAVTAGFFCVALAGLGSIIVGLFPENDVSVLHIFGAALSLGVGNVGLIILGLTWNVSKVIKIYTLLSGIVGLLGLMLFVTHNYIGLGSGGVERIADYSFVVWTIFIGFNLLFASSKKIQL